MDGAWAIGKAGRSIDDIINYIQVNHMKAIGFQTIHEGAEPEALEDIELDRPKPSARDLLVQVKAVSVNPVDTKVRRRTADTGGVHQVLGWDAVGKVVAMGGQATSYQIGDRVWYAGDITRPGANAEYHLVDERIVGRCPETLSDAEAAAIPLTAITAWELLFDRLGFDQTIAEGAESRPRLLIVGAAGGVGSILVQLAKRLSNAVVIGTASRPESQTWVMDLGADHVIDHRRSFAQELTRIGIDKVTHVISLNHTDDHFDNLVDVLAPQGKFALIDDPQTLLDVRKLKQKSISLHWELMFTRSMFQTDDMTKQRDLLNRVAELIDTGDIRTTVGANYGAICADNLRRAHRDIESGRSIGKIVLEGFG